MILHCHAEVNYSNQYTPC